MKMMQCMEIILKSLDCLGLKNVKLVLGSAKFYKRLLELVVLLFLYPYYDIDQHIQMKAIKLLDKNKL